MPVFRMPRIAATISALRGRLTQTRAPAKGRSPDILGRARRARAIWLDQASRVRKDVDRQEAEGVAEAAAGRSHIATASAGCRAAAKETSVKAEDFKCPLACDASKEADGAVVEMAKAKCVHPERPVAKACKDCPRK